MLDPVRWQCTDKTTPFPGKLRLIDQTRLPGELVYVELDDAAAIHCAIQQLVVRGAPAIGCAAAYGLAAVLQHSPADRVATWITELRQTADFLATARPTAVNLFWALERCVTAVNERLNHTPAATTAELKLTLFQAAEAIFQEDLRLCQAIGDHGLSCFGNHQGVGVLTHCNAGALATSDYGTALAPIYRAQENGLQPRVFADETRPLLQGSRLTAWELQRAGVEVTVICDNMAAVVMQAGLIDLVIVGADRIAANGDVANKIGTYGVAILARHHNLPFYVAAPYSTVDASLASGAEIPIEQRDGREITQGFGCLTAPADCRVFNPAFDVTPHELITGIITERGIFAPGKLPPGLRI